MKKTLKNIVAAITFTLLTLPQASAAIFTFDENYISNLNEKHTENSYIGGNNVNIIEQSNADLFTIGNTISITGNVKNDLFAAGSTISISNEIQDDLRAAGATITIGSKIKGETMLAGGQITLLPTAVLEKNSYIAGNQIILDGTINDNITVKGERVALNGTINGNINIETSNLIIGEKAIVKGTLSYKSPQQSTIPDTAKIKEIQYQEKVIEHRQPMQRMDSIFKLLTSLATALLFFAIFRKNIGKIVTETFSDFGKKTLAGLGFSILTPIATIMILVTFIGIPISILLGITYFLFIMLSKIGATMIFGTWIFSLFKKTGNKYEVTWLTIITGSIAMFAISIIPIVGSLIYAIFFLAAFGQLSTGMYKWLSKSR